MSFILALMDATLDHFEWYRRWCGGHWELWWVDVIHATIWHQVGECSLKTKIRPHLLCRGTPLCEQHEERMMVDW
jgi:hypothetical protein